MRKLKTGRLVLLALLPACGDTGAGPAVESSTPVVGIIDVVEWVPRSQTAGGERASVLAAPDTVRMGIPFAVTVTTRAVNSCWREAGAEIQREAKRVVITPYDQLTGHGCRDGLVSLPRTVQVVFTQRGEATLRVEGRRVFDGNLDAASFLAVEKRIHVQ